MPREWKTTSSEMSECVPTTTFAAPVSISASAASRAFLVIDPVSSATFGGSDIFASIAPRLRACCCARTSVGAMNAPWCPLPTAARIASAATTVLPHPTSPWSIRSIGFVPAMSCRISSIAFSCPRVSEKSSTDLNSSHSCVDTTETPSPPPFCARSRSRRRLVCSRTSSSNASRSRAAHTRSTLSGAWMCAIASACDMRSSSDRTLDSRPRETLMGSAGSLARSSATAARWISGHLSGATSCFFGYVGTTSTSHSASGRLATCIASAGFSSVSAPRAVLPLSTPRTHARLPGVSCRSTSTGTYSQSFVSNCAIPPAPSSTSRTSVDGVLCPHPRRLGGAFR